MPYKEHKVKKVYYTIGEVADLFNIETSAIRHWEGEFGKLHYKMGRKKRIGRLFTIDSIELINKIYFYLKVAKHTIEGTKRQLENQYYD